MDSNTPRTQMIYVHTSKINNNKMEARERKNWPARSILLDGQTRGINVGKRQGMLPTSSAKRNETKHEHRQMDSRHDRNRNRSSAHNRSMDAKKGRYRPRSRQKKRNPTPLPHRHQQFITTTPGILERMWSSERTHTQDGAHNKTKNTQKWAWEESAQAEPSREQQDLISTPWQIYGKEQM